MPTLEDRIAESLGHKDLKIIALVHELEATRAQRNALAVELAKVRAEQADPDGRKQPGQPDPAGVE